MLESIFTSHIGTITCPLCKGYLHSTYKGNSDLELTCPCRQLEVNFALFFDKNLDIRFQMECAVLKIKIAENKICKFHQFLDLASLELYECSDINNIDHYEKFSAIDIPGMIFNPFNKYDNITSTIKNCINFS